MNYMEKKGFGMLNPDGSRKKIIVDVGSYSRKRRESAEAEARAKEELTQFTLNTGISQSPESELSHSIIVGIHPEIRGLEK
jgi:hypothetical protein